MERALYGPTGFYVVGEGAAGHFRTSVSASSSVRDIFAGAIAELLDRVDCALGHPGQLDLVDVGGGSGELLAAVLAPLGSGLCGRVRPCVVERRLRPPSLPPYVRWLDHVPDTVGLLIANEWLDNIAIDVADVPVDEDSSDAAGAGRVLLVDATGTEVPGPSLTAEEQAWLRRWWPSGRRREIGLYRDAAWAVALSRVRRGLAVAIDYTHTADDRPAYGTLTGFRLGRETAPIPDGSCDLTAHVAIDSVAAAGEAALVAARRTQSALVAARRKQSAVAARRTQAAGAARRRQAAGAAASVAAPREHAGAAANGAAARTLLTDQRTALRALGVSGGRPDYRADPGGYAAALQRASDSAELIDPAGLGAFAWLLQGIDLDPTAILSRN